MLLLQASLVANARPRQSHLDNLCLHRALRALLRWLLHALLYNRHVNPRLYPRGNLGLENVRGASLLQGNLLPSILAGQPSLRREPRQMESHPSPEPTPDATKGLCEAEQTS